MKELEKRADAWCHEHTCHTQMSCHADAYESGWRACREALVKFCTDRNIELLKRQRVLLSKKEAIDESLS